MKDNFEFSVLLSVYKAENPVFLNECLKSIFDNSLVPDEVVIVEDGPLTDELNKVLNSFSKKHNEIIKRVPIEYNVGLGQALSIGLKACSHSLVARMDTDDICISNRFELQIKEFQEDNDLVIVGSYIEEFEGDSQKTHLIRKVPLNQKEIFEFAKKRNPFNHVTVMFKKDKVLEVGNYRKVMDIGYEDYDLWVRILKAGFKVKNIDIPTVKVRTGKDMLKRRGDKKRLKTALYFRKYLLNIGFISRIEWLVYSFFTIVFVFSPVSIKGWAYKNLLRK